jgi:phosphoribosylformylglycinamidine (FGAM) synthase-like enzyme
VLGKLVLAGVALPDICLCDNFYTPDMEPDGFGWLVAMVHELARLVEAFGTPLVSGKDSSAGSVLTSEGLISVPPGVFLSAVGKASDHTRLRRNEWQEPGNVLVRIGPSTPSPAGTVAARAMDLQCNPCLDQVSPTAYREYLQALADTGPAILSGRPIGPGGTLACLTLGAIASEMGVELMNPGEGAQLVQEHRCGAIVEVPEHRLHSLPDALEPQPVGIVRAQGPSLRLGEMELLAPGTLERWSYALEALLG